MPRSSIDDLQPIGDESPPILLQRVRRQFSVHMLQMTAVLAPAILAMQAPRFLDLFYDGTLWEFIGAQVGVLLLQSFSIAAGLRLSHAPLQDSSIAVSIGRLATRSYVTAFVLLLGLPWIMHDLAGIGIAAALAIVLGFVIYTVTMPVLLWRSLRRLDGRPMSAADAMAMERYLRPWPASDRSHRGWLRAPLVNAGEAIGLWIVAETLGDFLLGLPLTVWVAFGIPALWLVVRIYQLIRQA